MGRKRCQNRKGKVFGEFGLVSGVTFEICDVRSIDEVSTSDVFDGDGAVADVVVGNHVFQGGIRGAAEKAGKLPGAIGVLELTASEELFLPGYCS